MVLELFELDPTTPRPGIVIKDGLAARETNGGWVTLKSTTPITKTNRQWAIKIVDHGEGNDGSGLMVGILPKTPPDIAPNLGSKYISELGGWCFSRAGESYGSWKCDRVPFGTGSVIEFDLDLPSKTLSIVCGKERGTGYFPYLAEGAELYPAISMYYLNQKVMFV